MMIWRLWREMSTASGLLHAKSRVELLRGRVFAAERTNSWRLAPGRSLEHKESAAAVCSRPGRPIAGRITSDDTASRFGRQRNMATVIPLHRRRPTKTAAQQKAAAAEQSAERFWRNSMVPASIAMGVIIVLALAALVVVAKTGALGHTSKTWVLVAALVSVIGLTKIIIANMFFFILMQDDARLNELPATPPGPRPSRQTRLLHMPPRPAPRRPLHETGRRGRLASLHRD